MVQIDFYFQQDKGEKRKNKGDLSADHNSSSSYNLYVIVLFPVTLLLHQKKLSVSHQKVESRANNNNDNGKLVPPL